MRLFMADGNRRSPHGMLPALRRQRLTWLLVGVALLCTAGLFGQSDGDVFPVKPDPAVFVHDYSGWLTGQEKDVLEAKLRGYADSTSTEVVVMIRPEIGDYDRSSYAFELGNRWGIGRKSKNNGVVVLIVTEPPNRGVFIATGYGTEGALPDITAGRIIRNTMLPYFRQEQYYQGIEAGVNGIIRALSGEFKSEPRDRKSPPIWIFLVLFFVIMIVVVSFARFMAKHGTIYTSAGPQHRRNRRDDWWGGGGFGGGGWGGGGGFGGFGGGGWGGGGFGGGSFGGGGAGGSW